MKKLIIINIILLSMYLLLPTIHTSIVKLEHTRGLQRVNNEMYKIIPNYNISYDMSLLEPSRLQAEDYERMFKGTAMSGLGKTFAEAEAKTGVNGIYLAGLGCLESAYGTSGFARERNNLFGYQAYDYNLNATKYFETKEAGVLFVAERIKNNYLTVGGAYYSGITMGIVSKRYASDPSHSYKIFIIMKKLVEKGIN